MALFRELGPYKIVKRLGKGGMGEVYLADDIRKSEGDPTRRVALKVLWHDMERDNPGVIEAERQGAILQGKLHQIDNRVVRVNAYGDEEEVFYIDMEYVDGEDLAERIAQGPLSPLEAVRLALELSDILQRVHTMGFEQQRADLRGVVHGDIKPRNIRLDRQGKVRLMDFGIARVLSMTRRLTRNDFGSVRYSSPERLRTGQVDEHSDLWALAVILYEMLTGVPPFVGEDTRKIESRILDASPPPPLPASFPAPLREVVARALAPRLEDRYLSAIHLKEALLAVFERLRFGDGGSDATRRTTRDSDAGGATIRATPSVVSGFGPASSPAPVYQVTAQPVSPLPASGSLPPELSGQPASPPPPAKKGFRWGLLVFLVLLAGAGALGYNELRVSRMVPEVARDIEGRSMDCTKAYEKYQSMLGSSFLKLGVGELAQSIAQVCEREAEQIIARYKTNESTVKESDWKTAGQLTRNALTLTSSDKLEAWDQYIEGQLLRINKEYDKAIVLFNKAAELDTFCDPYLGLMHLYAYGVQELKGTEEARARLVERSCQPGNKDIWLADAYLREADRVQGLSDADEAPEKKIERLGQVRAWLVSAAEIYAQYPGKTTSAKLKQARGKVKKVDESLAALQPATPTPAPEAAPAGENQQPSAPSESGFTQ